MSTWLTPCGTERLESRARTMCLRTVLRKLGTDEVSKGQAEAAWCEVNKGVNEIFIYCENYRDIFVDTSASAAHLSTLASILSRPPRTRSKARLVGAKTVKGPPASRLSARSVSSSALVVLQKVPSEGS